MYEIVDMILCPRNSIEYRGCIMKSQFDMTIFSDYFDNHLYSKPEIIVDEIEEDFIDDCVTKKLNSYGAVSIILIIGSLLITFGVIISIIMVVGGM